MDLISTAGKSFQALGKQISGCLSDEVVKNSVHKSRLHFEIFCPCEELVEASETRGTTALVY
jgi:hypothetical protein